LLMKALEILEDVDGSAVPFQVDSETINIGTYDISKGITHKLWLRNSNPDVICGISDLDTVNSNSKFHKPVDEIQPLQQIQVSIEIPPMKISEDTAINDIEMPPGNDRLKGELTWKKY